MTDSTTIQEMEQPQTAALHDCLFRIGRVMEQVMDLDPLLLTIIRECMQMLRSEAASVAIYDAERDDLVFTVAIGDVGPLVRQGRVVMGEGVAGTVARIRTSLIINDPQNNPVWSDKVDRVTGFTTRNLAAVPMTRKGALIGVLEVINRIDHVGFRPNDLILMQLFADQVAVAIENQQLIQARQESERLATFGLALADIGHSVKNILLRLEFPVSLIDQAIQTQDWKILSTCWPVMKQATSEIGSLVREMLSFSKAGKVDIRLVDVTQLTAEVLETCLTDANKKNIQLIMNCKEKPLSWPMDAAIFRAGLHNLVGNAIEAIVEQGASGGEEARIALNMERINGDILRIVVRDNGPGITPEIQKRIFDPFFTTKKSKGTGLGLANVKKGVEIHGGRVWLDSKPGEGSTFTLDFPNKELAGSVKLDHGLQEPPSF